MANTKAVKYDIIFSDEFDHLYVGMREVTGSVIICDDKGQYYYTMIVTFDRLLVETIDEESDGSTDVNAHFWTQENAVILLDISKQGILNALKSLLNRPIEEFMKPMEQDILERFFYPKECWEIHTIEQFIEI